MITGYPFRQAIMDVDKEETLKAMGVKPRGKIISFFDEMSFGAETQITEEHCVRFWQMIVDCAKQFPDHTLLIKPKDITRAKDMNKNNGMFHDMMSCHLILRARKIIPNAYILDDKKWSFIETIGVSDIVVTQGMFSSATIALICEKEGLYFDESGYSHPLKDRYKDILVFDDKDRLFEMIRLITIGYSTRAEMSVEELRSYSKYNNGVEMIRGILA